MLQAISECVKKNNADIGLGFDGDGDRVGVIDNRGDEIFADKIGLLIARNLSNKHQGSKFIVDVKSTGLYLNDDILIKNNCKTIYWKTGHSHIKKGKLKRKKLSLDLKKVVISFLMNQLVMVMTMVSTLLYKSAIC